MSDVVLGDCLEVMKTFQDNQFDIVITDPPYGKQWARGKNGFGQDATLIEKFKNLDWDKFTPTKEYFDEIFRVSKHQIIFGGNYFNLPLSNCWLVWDKVGAHKFSNPFADCELIWTSFNTVVKKYTVVQQGFVKDSKDKRVHPTQKPTELMKMIISDYTKEDWTILDPFAGSGSTLKAAKDLGRTYTGIEINESYVEIIKERLRQGVLL